MPHAPFRLLRTALVGSTVFGLAAGAHILAGGTLPALPIMAAILALHIMCSSIATNFRLTLPTMVALLASSQLVLHKGFELLSNGNHIGTVAGTVGPENTHLGHHAMSTDAYASAMMAQTVPGVDAAGHAVEMSGWMLAGHVVATLAAAALLAYGENALWSLAHWLRPLYRRAAVVLELPAKQARPGVIPRPLPRLPWRNLRPNTRRGPPAGAAVFV
ncbi:hypothetical protein AAGW05_12575 [Arthrobacter sp. LAPM80]|uniref:hypothetical protein n=1 Tax=Arthrobacter sp. LAPM80 TaxID=3141788 RepID=UPI00398B20D4